MKDNTQILKATLVEYANNLLAVNDKERVALLNDMLNYLNNSNAAFALGVYFTEMRHERTLFSLN